MNDFILFPQQNLNTAVVTIPLTEYENMKEKILFLEGVAKDTHVYEISNYPVYTMGFTKDDKIKDQQEKINMLEQEISELNKKLKIKKKGFWF